MCTGMLVQSDVVCSFSVSSCATPPGPRYVSDGNLVLRTAAAMLYVVYIPEIKYKVPSVCKTGPSWVVFMSTATEE